VLNKPYKKLTLPKHISVNKLEREFVVREELTSILNPDITWAEIKFKINAYFQIHKSNCNKNAYRIYLLFINNHVNNRDIAIEVAAKALNLNEKTIDRHLSDLEKTGLLVRGKKYKGGYDHPVNTYTFLGWHNTKLVQKIIGVLKAIARGGAHIRGEAAKIAKKIKSSMTQYVERGKYFLDVALIKAKLEKDKQMSLLSTCYSRNKYLKKNLNKFKEQEVGDMAISFKTQKQIEIENKLLSDKHEKSNKEWQTAMIKSKEQHEKFLEPEIDPEYGEDWGDIIANVFRR